MQNVMLSSTDNASNFHQLPVQHYVSAAMLLCIQLLQLHSATHAAAKCIFIGLICLHLFAYAGWKALRGITPSCGTDVSAAPLLAILYIAMNLTYNVSVLTLLRTAGESSFPLLSC